MPKRVIDFDAMWASDKLASCAEWAQAEYAWLYGLADASGSFELTNLRVIWGRVAAVRKNLSLERLEQVFDEFIARGLLFVWEENGKRYGHWTGSDQPGRLPPPSWRARLERLAPPVPQEALAAYTAQFARGLKPRLEPAQAQDWEREKNRELEKQATRPGPQDRDALSTRSEENGLAFQGLRLRITRAEDLLLSEAFPWVERQAEYRRMESWLEANPLRRPKSVSQFAQNWFRKIAPPGGASGARALAAAAEARVGSGPAGNVRIRAEALARILAREATPTPPLAAPEGGRYARSCK